MREAEPPAIASTAYLAMTIGRVLLMGIAMIGTIYFIAGKRDYPLGRKADMKALLLDMAAGIIEEETSGIKNVTEELLVRNIAARLACHKSVRGSEHLTNAELTQMMADLDKVDEPDKCPHGRPTRITLSPEELERLFGRR